MEERRFSLRSWGNLILWIVIWGGLYLWQIPQQGGFERNLGYIVMDAVLFGFGLLFWLAFFAQFVLPVRTFGDRHQIFDRLLLYLTGGHGPAIFIENGTPIKHFEGIEDEEKKKGPGVFWLDSASAAVTRTRTQFKKTIGPGVHFTDKDEYLACAVDLHKQMQKLGPREEENPFAKKKEEQSENEYEQIQTRRLEVSAWTRDGIEVVPNITVTFKIDAEPAKGEEIGSRFGFDPEAVRKAVTGESINPGKLSEIARRRIAWNQLPALLAVDLWREYLAKFTLGQLFEAEQELPPEPLAPSKPAPAETQAQAPSGIKGSGTLTEILHALNSRLEHWADRCEAGGRVPIKVKQEVRPPTNDSALRNQSEKVTALQIINHMIKARMTRVTVPVLDDSGQLESGILYSQEYKLLHERGLKIDSVSVGGLRFAPAVEEQLVRQWNANWLDNAHTERERIDRQRSLVELDERVEAVGAYADSLSRHLLKTNPGPTNPRGTLKTLLLRTRDALLQNDRLHRRASLEREELEAIIQWVEGNGP